MMSATTKEQVNTSVVGIKNRISLSPKETKYILKILYIYASKTKDTKNNCKEILEVV